MPGRCKEAQHHFSTFLRYTEASGQFHTLATFILRKRGLVGHVARLR